MKRVIAAAIALLTLAYPASHGRADEVPRALTFNASAGGFSFAKKDQFRGQPVFDLRVGYDIIGTSVMDSLSIEGGVSYVATQSTTDNKPVSAYLLRVDALYPFLPRGRVVPFLTIGAGSMLVSTSGSLDKTPLLAYGAGFKYYIQDFVAFRFDLRQNLIFDITTRSNLQYMVGFSFLIDRDKKIKRLPAPPPSREVKSKSSIRPLNVVEPEEEMTAPVPPAEPEQKKQPQRVKESIPKLPALPLVIVAPVGAAAQALMDESEDEEVDPPEAKPAVVQKKRQPGHTHPEIPEAVHTHPHAHPLPEPAHSHTHTHVAPQAVAPEPVLPEPVLPEPVLTQPVLPEPTLPEPALPEPTLPEPTLPEPALPEPVLTEPVLPEPVLPEPLWSVPGLPETPLPEPAQIQPQLNPWGVKGDDSTRSAGSQQVPSDALVASIICQDSPSPGAKPRALPSGAVTVYFDSGSAVVKKQYLPKLKVLASYLKKHPQSSVQIRGHADNRGAPELNAKLSRKRTANIKKALTKSLGRAKVNIDTAALGCGAPRDDNANSAGRQNNRRATVEVVKNQLDPA